MTPIFTMLCGLPGSGKSTFTSELSHTTNAIICSSDRTRAELYGNEDTQDHNDEVFKVLHNTIKDNLRQGKSVIYDATNINSKRRRAFLSELKRIICIKNCVIIATPYEKCLEQNSNRDRKVPEEVIKRMYTNWNTPYRFEGWDNITIHNTNSKTNNPYLFLVENEYFNQDNPHHTMPLGKHCEEVAIRLPPSTVLRYAGMVHDCGKPFTKTFTNCKGEVTDIAHYYNHHNIGAYDSLFFMYDAIEPKRINPLDVSILVNLHMQPYFWEKDKENGEKTREKLLKLWGSELYEDVMALHKADKNAH